MELELVTFKTAKLAKQKGLPVFLDSGSNCNVYNNSGQLSNYHVHFNYPDKNEYTYAPYQDLLKKWLRVEHNYHISIELHNTLSGNKFQFFICKPKQMNKKSYIFYSTPLNLFDTYEKAMEPALEHTLNLLKDV